MFTIKQCFSFIITALFRVSLVLMPAFSSADEDCTGTIRECFDQMQEQVSSLEKTLERQQSILQVLNNELAHLIHQQRCHVAQSKGENIFCDPLKDGSFGPEMVVIPAGTFRMGDIQDKGDDDEQPVHEVSIKSFAIGRYEITFAEYDKFADATGREKPKDEGWGRGNRPVINVSWEDATAYAEWLSKQTGKQYRLPTEAEWEYAARAGTETKYWWGNEIGKNRANCGGGGSQWDLKSTSPVGSFAANDFGLYDTVGNVLEWVIDQYHDSYEGAPTDGSAWDKTGDDRRVLRGGSWLFNPELCRAAIRLGFNLSFQYHHFIGFRVVVAQTE